MDTGGYSSSENQCHRRAVLSQNAITQGQRAPKTHLIPEASAVMALANLANSGALGEDEAGTDAED